MDEDTITYLKMTIFCEPVSTFNNDRFAWIIVSYVILSARVEGKQQNLSTTLARCRYRFMKSSVLGLSL